MKKVLNILISFFENAFYYLGAMTLFNFIYALKLFGTNFHDGKKICYCHLIAFIIAGILCIIGVVSTIITITKDHSIKQRNTLGKNVTVVKCENITGDNFFSKYSILVLTGNSLPVYENFVCIVVYLVVLFTLGIVYSTQKMYFMNPCLGIMNYNIVKATCKTKNEKNENFYFIHKTGNISEGMKISFLNIPNHIIRLKEIKNDTGNKTTN